MSKRVLFRSKIGLNFGFFSDPCEIITSRLVFDWIFLGFLVGFESLHAELKMMLRTGDLHLNQFGDSMKETVKRTMLQHEIVFKNQVRELHRLYWTQKNLMRELYRREAEANLAKEGNVVSLDEVKGKFVDMSENRHNKSFNHELPAAVYTVDAVKNSMADKLLIGSEMFIPGCSAKEAVVEKGGGMISLLDKGKNLYCYEVIDLEDPVEIESHVEARGISFNGFKVPMENCGAMGNSRSEIASDMASSSRVQNERGFVPYSLIKEPGFVPDLNHSNTDCSERLLEHKADQSGAGGSESSVAGLIDASTDSTHKQEPKSSKLMLIDLNVPQDDESCHTLNDPMLTFSSPSSSSSVVQNELFWRDQVNTCPKETSPALNSDALHSVSRGKSIDRLFSACHNSQRSMVSDFGIKEEHEAGNKVQGSNSTGLTECCINSLERLSSDSNVELPSDTNGKALSSIGFNIPVEENEDLLAGRLHATTTHIDLRQTSIVMADKQASHERSEVDTFSSHAVGQDEKQQDGVHEKVPTGSSRASVPTRISECASLEKLADELSGTTQSESLIVESSLEKSCDIEQKHDQDCGVFDAAEILAGISLTQSSPPWEQLDTVTEEDERDQPQYSTDSYEAMTLELLEVRSEEHLIPTRQIEAEDAGEGSSGVNKLRRSRGRVVRDFQKDILPGMVSLSRHEIFEDMHSIGYKLRKNGLRRAGGGNWFVPVRSRRSRRYPVGRRN